jgi:hypothetical protein
MGEKERSKIALDFLKALYQKQSKPVDFGIIVDPIQEFSVEEVEAAWMKHKSNKAIGPDYFDHRLIKTKMERKRFCTEIATMMNTRSIPDYLKIAKCMLLSKKSGIVCKPEESRCINLLNHTFKVMEIVIKTRMDDSPYFATGEYQAGFKKGASCGTD